MATEVAAGGSNPFSALASAALGDRFSERAKRAAVTYMAVTALVTTAKKINDRYRNARDYTITVHAYDELYDDVLLWVSTRVPRQSLRSLVVKRSTGTNDGMVTESPDGAVRADAVRVYFAGSKAQTLVINDQRVRVEIEREESKIVLSSERRELRDRVVFTASNDRGRDAVLELLRELSPVGERDPRLYIASRYGDWRWRNDLPPRPLNTVILPDDQRDGIVADLEKFRAEEDVYATLGMPYHRGYLFHGPPGTGKTSLARALAHHFRLDIYYLSLSAFTDDESFINLVSSVPAGSVLLLEDIDVLIGSSHDRDEKDANGISLSALLNAIDGVVTPHGLILIMTTNDIETLDDALVRTGRADVIEHIGLLTDDQLERLVKLAFPDYAFKVPELKGAKVAPAEVLEILKTRLHDPAAATRALKALVRA